MSSPVQNSSTLFILQHPPYGIRNGRDAIEAALAFAAYEQKVAILFIGDGVYQLLEKQLSETIGQKSHPKLLSALPMYDIEDIFVCDQSLKARGLQDQPLCITPESLKAQEINALCDNYQTILSF